MLLWTHIHIYDPCALLQPVEPSDDAFWDQFWADTCTTVQDVFALVPAAEIRAVREESPSNLATLCYKVICIHKRGGASVVCRSVLETVTVRGMLLLAVPTL